MTCYFIMYVWRQRGQSNWNFSEDLTKEHPIQWLINCRKAYSEENLGVGNITVFYDYSLINWKEIPKEVYDEFKDEVG